MKTKFNILFSILFSSILLGMIYNSFSSDGIDFIREPIIIKSYEELIENDSLSIGGINLADAINLYNSKVAKFVDARDQWDFEELHIKDAINIPEFSFIENDSNLTKYSKEQIFVIYCHGDDCDISKRLATYFVKLGYRNSYVYLGGIDEWEKSGMPIQRGVESE